MPKKSTTLRKWRGSGTDQGTWIYVLWCPRSSKCYVGQCGGKDNVRAVIERMREHILLARDWIIGFAKLVVHRAKHPLYQWMACRGVHNIQVTIVERVASWMADINEVQWMHKFPRTYLLNVCVPGLRKDRWSWLLGLKTWARAKFVRIHACGSATRLLGFATFCFGRRLGVVDAFGAGLSLDDGL